jgi:hypothetical protein
MKSLIASIRTCPRAVTAVSLGSLALLMVKTVWLNQLPARFALAPSLGLLVEGLLSATVAAYLFFILSVQLPQVLERQLLGAFIVDRAESVANGVMGFLQMIAGSTAPAETDNHIVLRGGLLDQQTVDLGVVNTLFSRVSPNADAPMAKDWQSPPLSWLAAMARHDVLRAEASDRLLQLGRFLDSELIALLHAIENSRHSAGMRSVREDILTFGGTLTNQDLKTWAANYYESYELARRLREYSKRFRVLYGVQGGYKPDPNKSLDASGGCVFRIIIGPAMLD